MLVDSPFARELERGVWRRRFAAPLETQYIQERLSEGRLVIRVACVLSALIVLLRGAELVHAGSGELWTLIDLAIVGMISVALANVKSRLNCKRYVASGISGVFIGSRTMRPTTAASRRSGLLQKLNK